MSKNFKALAAAAFSFFALSCSLVSFEGFTASVSLGECQNYYDGELVTFCFSCGVNPAAAEALISLKEDGSVCEAEFFWFGKSCALKARGGFKKGRKYSLLLNGNVLTNDGRSYDAWIFREFIFGRKEELFLPLDVELPEKNNLQKSALVFLFNKPVDAAVFEREFNLSPGLETIKNYSSDKTRVEIKPASKWKANAHYVWRLGKTCALDGTKIFSDYTGSFIVVEKVEPPRLLRACPVLESGAFAEGMDLTGFWERQAIGLVFDSDMDYESVKNGVSFLPYVDGYWSKKDERRFFFVPYQNYKLEEEYMLTVSDAVEDMAGLRLKDSVNISFKSQCSFITAKVFLNGEALCADRLNKIKAAQNVPLIFTLEFSRSLSQKSVEGIKNAASLAAFFPTDSSAPNLESVKFFGQKPSSFALEYGGVDFSGGKDEKIYAFKISGGANFIYDDYGEYLKEDACFYFTVEK